jgi:hypothetical protein
MVILNERRRKDCCWTCCYTYHRKGEEDEEKKKKKRDTYISGKHILSPLRNVWLKEIDRENKLLWRPKTENPRKKRVRSCKLEASFLERRSCWDIE